MADAVMLSPAVPEAGQDLTITYDPTCTPLEGENTVFIRYGVNGFQMQNDVLVTSNGAPYEVTIPIPIQATEVNFVFKNEGETFDNNDGEDYNFDTINGVPNSPRVSTTAIVADSNVTVTYTPAGGPLVGADPIYMHYGFNSFNPTINPDVLMTTNGAGGFEATVPVKSYAETMDMVFNDSGDGGLPGTTTDNNDGFDWHFAVTGTIPRIALSPNPPVATEPCTITYNAEDTLFDASTTGFRKIHWGINSFPAPFGPDIEMTSNGQVWTGVIPEVPLRAEVLAFVIHDSAGAIGDLGTNVDNNNGGDFRFDTIGAKPLTNELDGLYVAKTTGILGGFADGLNIGLAGNLVDDGSAFVIFIDSPDTAGQTELRAIADGGNGSLSFASRQEDAIKCETFSEGTILPGEADYALVVNRSGESVFFNQYRLSDIALPGEEITCCTGGTIDRFATQIYTGDVAVNDGFTLIEGDQALFYEGGFNDTDTNGAAGVSGTGLEVMIPYFNIGVLPDDLKDGDDFSVFVALMPNAGGLLGQFSNQTLPPNTGDLCVPPQVLPLRSDLSQFSSVWTGNTGTLPEYSGITDGVISASDYSGSVDETQTCDRPEMVPDPAVSIDGLLEHGETVTVVYASSNGPLVDATSIDMQVSFDEFATSNGITMTADPCEEDRWTADLFVESNGLPLLLSMRFTGDTGADDNSGQLWEFSIDLAERGETVVINPNPVQAGELLTVTYDPVGRPIEGGEGISAHYGFNNWSTGITDKKMIQQADCTWEMTVTASELAAGSNGFDVVFFDTNGTYDNNDGADWHFKAVGGIVIPWTMDGELDCCSTLVGTSQNGTRHLYAGYRDGWIYVATESSNTTAANNDHFIFVADELPASQTGHPWAKAGTVGAFDAYLAREQSNNFVGWFNIAGSTVSDPQTNNAQYLEGSFNLAEQIPTATTTLWIAHGAWGNNDGDPLTSATQVPATLDDNGNIEAAEYFEMVLSSFEVTMFDDYDFNQDCAIDGADFQSFEACLGGPGVPIPGACTFESIVDQDADNDVDLVDFSVFMEAANSCP
ncbi:MAG: hypothetical protein DHS20C16_18110 [Phycisphaerae bacterium]|nr:MAG: hypothetical protein DHS20C16_18110 [Phycisphaerae bacterium]